MGFADLWRDLLTPLPDGARALVISHSADIEMGLIAAFPTADHAAWGNEFHPCEGARLTFDGAIARFTEVRLLRT